MKDNSTDENVIYRNQIAEVLKLDTFVFSEKVSESQLSMKKNIITILKKMYVNNPKIFNDPCIAFVIYTLLKAFSHEVFNFLQEELLETSTIILHSVYRNDKEVYRLFITETLQLLEDLNQIYFYFNEKKQTIYVKCFEQFISTLISSEDTENNQPNWGLNQPLSYAVKDKESCMILQSNFTKMINYHLLNIPEILGVITSDVIWNIFKCQVSLQFLSTDLIISTLNVMRTILKQFTTPDYYYYDLFKIIFSILKSTNVIVTKEIEIEIGNCLQFLIQVDPRTLLNFTNSHSIEIVEIVLSNINNSKSEDFKNGLAEVFSLIAKAFPTAFPFNELEVLLTCDPIAQYLPDCLNEMQSHKIKSDEQPRKKRKISEDDPHIAILKEKINTIVKTLTPNPDLILDPKLIESSFKKLLSIINIYIVNNFESYAPAAEAFHQWSLYLIEQKEVNDDNYFTTYEQFLDISLNILKFRHNFETTNITPILKDMYELCVIPLRDWIDDNLEKKVICIKKSLEILCILPLFIVVERKSFYFKCLEKPLYKELALTLLPRFTCVVVDSIPELLVQLTSIEFDTPKISEWLSDYAGLISCISNATCVTKYVEKNKSIDISPIPYQNGAEYTYCENCDMMFTLLIGKKLPNPIKKVNYKFSLWKPLISKCIATESKAIFLEKSLPRILSHSQIDPSESFDKVIDLLTDKDIKIRNAMVNVMSAIASLKIVPSVDLFTKLQLEFQNQNDASTRETLLITISHLGTVNNEIESSVIMTLVEHLLHEEFTMRTIAFDQIQYFTKQKGVPLIKLIEPLKELIYPFLIRQLSNSKLVEDAVKIIYEVLNFKQWIINALPIALPRIIVEYRDSCSSIFPLIEKLCSDSIINLLRANLHYIYSHILKSGNNDNAIERSFELLAEYIPEPPTTLIKEYKDKLVYELIFSLYNQNPTKVLNTEKALELVASNFGTSNEMSVSELLQIKFLGINYHINTKVNSPDVSIEEKKQLLRSFEKMMRLLKDINSVRLKIMTTLKLFSKIKELHKELCAVYYTFINYLETAKLGSLLNRIIMEILPLFETSPTEATPILEYIYLKSPELMESLQAIPYLPDIPPLQKLKKVLAQADIYVNARFDRLLSGIHLETSTVRIQALGQLQNFIRDQKNFEKQTFGTMIGDLFRGLLVGCVNASNTEEKVGFGKCLGEIGAFDPNYNDLESVCLKPMKPQKKKCVQLAQEIMQNYLYNSINSITDVNIQNFFGYTIQELLKICGCKRSSIRSPPRKKPGNSKDIWDSFSPEMQEIFSPFLESQYAISKEPNRKEIEGSNFSYCLKNGHPNESLFNAWIAKWCTSLVSKASGDYCDIFKACSGSFKHNIDMALHLLPYLLLDILLHGAEADRASIKREILDVLQMGNSGSSPSKAIKLKKYSVGDSHICIQTAFSMIDILTDWLTNQGNDQKVGRGGRPKTDHNTHNQRIQQLLDDIPQKLMSDASYLCRAFQRALFHFENHLRNLISNEPRPRDDILRDNVDDLHKIYSEIDEPDGLSGIAILRADLIGRDPIKEYENTGLWADAFAYYEQLLQLDSSNRDYQIGRLKCLKQLGHYDTMLSLVLANIQQEGGLQSFLSTETIDPLFASYGVQASWRLSKWDVVDNLRKSVQTANLLEFEVSVGSLLLHLTRKDEKQFREEHSKIMLNLISSLSAAAMESYHRAYPIITRIHILQEIERSFQLNINNIDPETVRDELTKEWKSRLEITHDSYKSRELILTVRQVIYKHFGLLYEAQECWLELAKLARKASLFQTASNSLIHAFSTTKEHSPKLCIEMAKLQWDQGSYLKALLEIQNETKKVAQASSQTPGSHYLVKALLLEGKWIEKTGQKQSDDVIEHYNTVTRIKKWEKGFFILGKYYDALLQAQQKNNYSFKQPEETIEKRGAKKKDTPPKYLHYLKYVIKYYGTALKYGHVYIYQSLPRLLTLWFGNGQIFAKDLPNYKNFINAELSAVDKLMQQFEDQLPPYQWLTCFPQLISGICMPKNIFDILERIITKVLCSYSLQAFWSVVAVSKSTHNERQQRALGIISKAKRTNSGLHEFLDKASSFCEHLLNICNFQISSETTLTMSHHKEFKPLLKGYRNTFIVPLQSSLTVTLPSDGKTDASHNGFPDSSIVMIDSFHDRIDVMSSLIKPRKITVNGSDGREYSFLCKPKDDLRKDARMMDFNNMLNKLFKKEPQCRVRKLHIRTYAVIPLNETCGLIEWVPHTSGYRHILTRLMKAHYHTVLTSSEVRKIYQDKKKKPLDRYKMVLEFFPPIFYKWYIEDFPDPSSWFAARLAYARSSAVMSMVGHIVGLGDRHGENILLDEKSGDMVHIDLNCLFWKGLTFEEPEKVPFRLTPHMVDALGVSGYEGVFRKVCEIALRVLRDNRETLMSVLEPLIYDPLVEWKIKNSSKAKQDFVQIFDTVNNYLLGHFGGILPISVEGHVHKLIGEATNPDNLSKMYIGWSSWL